MLLDAELDYFRSGYGVIAGIDEAGRGSFAGPLTVALAVFSSDFINSTVPSELKGLDDSKKLSVLTRKKLIFPIREKARASSVVHIPNRTVDKIGINVATETAIIRAVEKTIAKGCVPDIALIDGNYRFPMLQKRFPGIRFESVVGGDGKIFSIAAASILAKVTRDDRMVRYGRHFPDYMFEKHKGYGTQLHRQKIQEFGPCVLHRRTYLKNMIDQGLI